MRPGKDSAVTSISFDVAAGPDGAELVVLIEGVRFVEEVIPDGSMAGMNGHRPVPWESRSAFLIHPDQAEMLIEALRPVADRG